MMSFLFGVVVGAVGFWLYRTMMPEMQGGQGGATGSFAGFGGSGTGIQRPSPEEVHGRPSEPIPSGESETRAETGVGTRTGT